MGFMEYVVGAQLTQMAKARPPLRRRSQSPQRKLVIHVETSESEYETSSSDESLAQKSKDKVNAKEGKSKKKVRFVEGEEKPKSCLKKGSEDSRAESSGEDSGSECNCKSCGIPQEKPQPNK